MSQSHAQRRRQQKVFRPRQTKNDVNVGSLAAHPAGEGNAADPAVPDRNPADFMRRCAERDLI